jgi:hypothetical protein
MRTVPELARLYWLQARLRWFIFVKRDLRVFAVRHHLVGPERLEKWTAETKQLTERFTWIWT